MVIYVKVGCELLKIIYDRFVKICFIDFVLVL